ncbi:hypothetical protein I552_4721 [Mycobacterium xenopi 3993]|nr:hypothetical protein I552_4721 [Mycobacterium xenopi 3993]
MLACGRSGDGRAGRTPSDRGWPIRCRAAQGLRCRLLFRHAAREPEFRDVVEALHEISTEITRRHLASIDDERWRSWAAHLLPTLTTDAVIAWLDAGQPDPEQAPERIRRIVDAVIAAATR